jgi:NTP pyrophosphatase (non-canonical NTP hydrolase)
MKIKHTLASERDKKCTILASEIKKITSEKPNVIYLAYVDHGAILSYHLSRNGKTYYGDANFPKKMKMPKIGKPIEFEVSLVNDTVTDLFTQNTKTMNLTNEFELIREWAEERGIYEKGDTKTQFLKLMEECGELGCSILKKDQDEFIDAIGDCVVVLTNLAALGNVKIEDCINSAYEVIAKRKGEMINGTFVKEK